MAGQIAHNFDEENWLDDSSTSLGKHEIQNLSIKKRNHKKKKSMQNLHPVIKREGLGMQRDPCISRLRLSGNHLPAGPGCSPSVDSCQGQNHPDTCSDRISIAFSSLRLPGRVDSCWKCALRYSGQLQSHAVTPPVCPDTGFVLLHLQLKQSSRGGPAQSCPSPSSSLESANI